LRITLWGIAAATLRRHAMAALPPCCAPHWRHLPQQRGYSVKFHIVFATGGAVGGVIGGINGVLGIGPRYAAYPVEEPAPVYYRRHRVRHSYRHLRHEHPTG
jgi:hypothetical protein